MIKREVNMSFGEIIIAIFFPPISVLLRYGLTGKFWLNILLTLVGWLPGVIHAFVVLSKEHKMSKV
jgi:uncharacterized membrane protein YqaE (UPF0057 family)